MILASQKKVYVSDYSDVDELRNMWRWREILYSLSSLFLTGIVWHEISRYYVYILFSRREHTASFNPQSAAHRGKTVSLCLPTSLYSLCLTLCTLLCIFWLPVPVNDIKASAEGRCFILFVITRRLKLLEVIMQMVDAVEGVFWGNVSLSYLKIVLYTDGAILNYSVDVIYGFG